MSSKDEAIRLMGKPADDLLVDLGGHLLGRGAVPAPSEVKIRAAQGWLKENEGKLKNIVCTQKVQELVKTNAGPIEICVAVGDLLLAAFAGFAPLTLAALLVKTGIGAYCQKPWNDLGTHKYDAAT